MPLMRWAAQNTTSRVLKVQVGLYDLAGSPASYPSGAVAEYFQLAAGLYGDDACAGCTWLGNRVGVTLQDMGVPGTEPKDVLPMPVGLGSSVSPDNIFELRVYVDRKGASQTEVYASIWGLDGLGGWWLLCDRALVALRPPP